MNTEVEDIEMVNEQQGEPSEALSEGQKEHFIALVEYLCGTYNALCGAIHLPEDPKNLTVVGMQTEVLEGVLQSLKSTANNFAEILGITLEERSHTTPETPPVESEDEGNGENDSGN